MASPRSALTDAELHQDRGNKVQVFWYTIMIIATITVALRFCTCDSYHSLLNCEWKQVVVSCYIESLTELSKTFTRQYLVLLDSLFRLSKRR